MPAPSRKGQVGPGKRRPESPVTSRRTSRTNPVDDASLPADPPPRIASRFTSRALILLLVMAVLGVSYASSIRAWLNQRSEEHSLTAQIAQEKATIAQLQTQKRRWNDPAYIEAQARLRFGWVMPGERSYRVIGKDGKVLTAGHSALAAPQSAGQHSAPPWWQGAVDSLEVAGSPPVAKKKQQPTRHPATWIGPAGGRSGR
jgi:cell division protein FtsB